MSKPKTQRAGGSDTKVLRRLETENDALRDQLKALSDLQDRLAALSEKFILINRISHDLNVLDLDSIGRIAVEKIPALIGARFASLFLYDYDADELQLLAHNHPDTLHERLKAKLQRNTIMGLALSRKSIVHIEDIEHYERTHKFRFERTFADKYATRSCISAPLLAGNRTVGIVNFADRLDGAPFSEIDDVPVVEQLGQVMAMAMRNCTLFAEVALQARTDALTKLANLRAFQEALDGELRRCARYRHPLTLLLLDVDNFKQINDRFGHPAGDAVLQRVADVLRQSIRREDVSARHGGDEFAVILIETPATTAEVVAGRLVGAVGRQAFRHQADEIPVTVSLGAAGYVPGMTAVDLIRTADRAMLLAKQKGKNQYVVAETQT